MRLAPHFQANEVMNVYDMQAHASSGPVDVEGPAWAPLRDSYMLTSSKLKDWDKMPVRSFFIILLSSLLVIRFLPSVSKIMLQKSVQSPLARPCVIIFFLIFSLEKFICNVHLGFCCRR